MSIYFMEPYNAYAKKRKRTAAEEIFEQNLQAEAIAKIIAEQTRLAEAATLPSETAPTAQATIVGPSAPAGAGGVPENAFFNRIVDGTYSVSSNAGQAPLTVNFSNPSTKYVTVVWNFGDGTYGEGPSVSHTFSTTGSYRVSVTASSDSRIEQSASIISASVPVVTAGFTAVPTTGQSPLTVQFTNTSVNASTYLWLFGAGSLSGSVTAQASSSLENPSIEYWKTGSYTVTLQASGSYTQYSRFTSSISASL